VANEGQTEATPASPEDAPRKEPSGTPAPVSDGGPLPAEAAPDERPAQTPARTPSQPPEPPSEVQDTAPAGAAESETPADEPEPTAGDDSQAEAPTGDGKKGGDRTGPPTLIVRYGAMGLIGRFTYTLDRWRRGQRVVIKSDRGMEIGTIVCRGSESADGGSKLRGEVLRLVTHTDEIEERHLAEDAERELQFCKARIAERKLPMKLVEAEHLFGGDRIIFYFLSESRVDFRALVRDLAREFQTRIEMRQIGVRDEARLLGDYERCGRPLCCRAWIKDLEPVSMKMAKIQKATLDPTKISGRCGRLMCCLRYEHATYRELAKRLPRKNTIVGTVQGRGKVVSSDVVTQIAGVLLESGTRINVPVESLIPPEEAPTSERALGRREAAPPPDDTPQAEAGAKPKPTASDAAPEAKPESTAAGRGPTGRRRRRRSKRGGRGRGRRRKDTTSPSETPNRKPKPQKAPEQGAKPRDSQGT